MNWLLLQNSFLVGAGAMVLSLTLGFMAALWLEGLPLRLRNVFLALAIIGLALPPFLVTNCWLDVLGAAGTWRKWLPFNILTLPGAIWILGLMLWPLTLLAVLSAWRRLEPAQLESDPGVTGCGLIRVSLLPLARSALVQAGILTFVLALNNFAVPAILQVKVLPAEMWIRFTVAFDSLGVLRLSWPLALVPILLLVWFARRSLPWPYLESPVSPALFRQQLGGGLFCLCGVGGLLLYFISAGVPLWQLASTKRTWTEMPGALAAGQNAIWNSCWFAASAASMVIGVSLVPAIKHHPAGRKYSNSRVTSSALSFFSAALWLPFLLPGVLLGIGLIAIFNRGWAVVFYQSAGIVLLAFVLRYLALGWGTVAHAAQAVDQDLVEVAQLEGANRWQMLRNVHWPQIKSQVAAAWYVVFLLCLWDVETMILVYPPGGETLALRIFNLLHYGHNAQVNALCLTLLGVAVAPLIGWQLASYLVRIMRVRHVPSPSTRMLVLSFVSILLLPGCSPSTSPRLDSRIFDRVEIIGTRGVGVGQLNKPRSVAVDRQDNVYVVDMTGRVQKFSPSGTYLLQWQMPQTDLGRPKGMGRDHDGDIVVVEPHYQRVNHFSTEGRLLAQWGQKGTNAGQLIMPRAVAVNSRGELFVSEYGEVERIQKFSLGALPGAPVQRAQPESQTEAAKTVNPNAALAPDTRLKPDANETDKQILSQGDGIVRSAHFLGSIGHAGTGPGEFNRPEGLCIDAQDRLYVADSCNHRIQVFSSDGKFLRSYGRPGKGKGELSYPYDICVDPAGRQYVCEFGNSRIQVFDANDQPLEIIGGPGADPGQFANPWSLALDSAGDLYVADSQNHRVQKLIGKEPASKRPQTGALSSSVLGQWCIVGNQWPSEDVAEHGQTTISGFGVPTIADGPR